METREGTVEGDAKDLVASENHRWLNYERIQAISTKLFLRFFDGIVTRVLRIISKET
jgi:hypothetical protein